jgi:hypothetical protein
MFEVLRPGLKLSLWFFILLSITILPFRITIADQYSSNSYSVLDPVVAVPSGYATSSGFQLWSVISQVAVGTSTSNNFYLNPGFLTYPYVSTPAVSATAGDAQVALSWTASSGFLGWTVGGYNVGQSSVAGGPYSYTSVGNVTSATIPSLTNNTTYYFVVVVKDSFGNSIATSTEVSATPAGSGGGSGGGGGGGGGGGCCTSFYKVIAARAL